MQNYTTKMYMTFKTHALPPVLREDIRADAGDLLLLQLCHVLQPPLQRCGCPSTLARMQTATSPVALESFSHVLPGSKGDYAEIF